MPIDLQKFQENKEVIAPIISGWGQVNGRKVWHHVEDGWYKIDLGNKAKIIQKASPLEIHKALENKKKLMVYALAGEGVPINFDNFKQRGYNESVLINFMVAEPFDVVNVVLWEDHRFYFYDINQRYEREINKRVKETFKGGGPLPEMRGLSQEIRFWFMLGNLQRESYERVRSILSSSLERISDIQRVRIKSQLQRSFKHILSNAITKAGGTYIGHNKLNKSSYSVTWKVGGQVVKSHIRADLRIISAGFCLNQEDTKHSMSSIIGLASEFQKDEPLYIGRE